MHQVNCRFFTRINPRVPFLFIRKLWHRIFFLALFRFEKNLNTYSLSIKINCEVSSFKVSKSLDGIQASSLHDAVAFSDLSSDTPLLASTHGELHSSLNSTHENSLSPLENCDISSSISSYFASKDELTSCLSSAMINFGRSIFEHHLSAVIYDFESVNSTDDEEPLHEHDLDNPSLSIEIDPFVFVCSKDIEF